jgi:hypothetical protein
VKSIAEFVELPIEDVLQRFRPNFVIDLGPESPPFTEDSFKTLSIGRMTFEVSGSKMILFFFIFWFLGYWALHSMSNDLHQSKYRGKGPAYSHCSKNVTTRKSLYFICKVFNSFECILS